jgi:hypothetical protein
MADGLRTARVSPRSFAKVVGCHYTTIYRLIKARDPNPYQMTEAALEKNVSKLEELIAEGKLPFDLGMTKKQKAESLQSLFAETN